MRFVLADFIQADFPRPSEVQRNCLRKTHYKSRGAAEAAVRASRRRAETCQGGDRLEVYQCKRCLRWLVGHTKEA